MIFDQQFEEGTLLKQGDIVGVTISAGKGGGTIIIPDLIGKSLTEAKKILADSSLIIGKINYQPSATLLPNTILDQYPSSGNSVNPGSAIDLFVTKPADIKIPNEEND
jgi:serine/threonine-protein kinase